MTTSYDGNLVCQGIIVFLELNTGKGQICNMEKSRPIGEIPSRAGHSISTEITTAQGLDSLQRLQLLELKKKEHEQGSEFLTRKETSIMTSLSLNSLRHYSFHEPQGAFYSSWVVWRTTVHHRKAILCRHFSPSDRELGIREK